MSNAPVQNLIKSMEEMNLTVTTGEPMELIFRLAMAIDSELDELNERIVTLEGVLGL